MNVPPRQYLDGFLAATGPLFQDSTPPSTANPPPTPEPASPPVEEPAVPVATPRDAFSRLLDGARENRPPDAADARRFQSFGCFYEGPQQDAFRLRLRLPGGRLRRFQLAGLAALAQELGGGWLEWNALAGLDLPAVPVRDVAAALRRVESLGLTTRGTGGHHVLAVRGGGWDGVRASAGAALYPLVCELEQAVAHALAGLGLPEACEVILREAQEPFAGQDDASHRDRAILFQRTATALVNPRQEPPWPRLPEETDEASFQLYLPEIGHLGVGVEPGQVVPVCLALLALWTRWARGDNSTLAAFCRDIGAEALRAALRREIGTPLRSVPPVNLPRTVDGPATRGIRLPSGRLLSRDLSALARLLEASGEEEIRLVEPGCLLVPPFGAPEADNAARQILEQGS